MRIIVRYCLPWGNFSTQAIDIDSDAPVETLQGKIFEKFNIPIKRQLIKFKRDGFTVRVINGWTLDFYEIKEKAILMLDSLDNLNKDDESQAFENIRMTGRYYAKLGILSTVKDEGEDEEDDDEQDRKSKGVMRVDSGANSDESSGDEGGSRKKKSKKTKSDHEIEAFLKEVKAGNMESIGTIFEKLREANKHTDPEEKVKKLINQNGSGGWNSLHFAIYLAHYNLVKDLLERGADINKQTTDGWTPLQLAMHRNNLDVARLLLKVPGIQMNSVTPKTSALHIATKNGRLGLVQLLLMSHADINIKNEDGLTPFEVASSDEIRRAIEQESLRQTDLRSTEEEEFRPPKPPIVKGWLSKLGALIVNVKRRYFIIDPDQGTFMRFRALEDLPNKPIEIIPLRDITNIKKIPASWLFNKNLYHFEITYSSRMILAAQSDEIATQWVTFLYQSVVYANWIDQKLKEDLHKLQKSSYDAVSLESDIANKPNEEITIIDEDVRGKSTTAAGNSKTNSILNGTTIGTINGSPNSSHSKIEKKEAPKGRAVTDFKKTQEENKKEQDSINNKAAAMISDEELKLDDVVNFNSFEILKQLGSGAFGKVYKVKKKDDGKIYAMKALKKRNLIMKGQLKYAITEANVLRTANHPFILSLHYAFQTPQYLYLVLDFCQGGDLSLHLAQRGKFEENEAMFFVAELIVAIEHLHNMNVIYRDLKPENILINDDGHVKLADFGLSKEGVADDANATSFCGSPAYLSPEMLKNKGVGKAADIYGIGAVLYEMLCGNSPYYSDDIPKMYSNIRKGKLTFPKNVSENAKNLTLKLLTRDPNQRIGVKDKAEIKRDPFFKDIDWDRLLRKEYVPPVLDGFGDEDSGDDELPREKAVHSDFDYDEKNKKANRVNNFTFIRKNIAA